jgi:hypothetical protein
LRNGVVLVGYGIKPHQNMDETNYNELKEKLKQRIKLFDMTNIMKDYIHESLEAVT